MSAICSYVRRKLSLTQVRTHYDTCIFALLILDPLPCLAPCSNLCIHRGTAHEDLRVAREELRLSSSQTTVSQNLSSEVSLCVCVCVCACAQQTHSIKTQTLHTNTLHTHADTHTIFFSYLILLFLFLFQFLWHRTLSRWLSLTHSWRTT